jgi:dolichol-phosphate mannosyltransferase
MKYSIVIPAMNEEGSLPATIEDVSAALMRESIDFELVVVNDNSSDSTPALCDRLAEEKSWFRVVHRNDHPGIGLTIRAGLEAVDGDAVAIMMADGSDSAEDLVRCIRTMERDNVDCVLGSRWMKGGKVIDYPVHKRIINRMANHMIRILFWIPYDDITNAFKLYKTHVIEGVRPLLSYHFNILAEIPLKAIVRGYSYSIIPITWKNRKSGKAKLKIKEMGSRYMFIVLYALLEKWLSRQDYHRANQ